jgi:hypothetical protein
LLRATTQIPSHLHSFQLLTSELLTRRKKQISAVLALVSVAVWLSSAAMASESNRIGIVTTSVVLEKNQENYVGEVIFSISGSKDMLLEVDLVDIWTDPQGNRITLAPGSTPLTGLGRLQIGKFQNEYIADGTNQQISIPVSITVDELSKAGLLSGVKLTMVEKTESESSPLKLISAAIAFVYGSGVDTDASGYLANFAIDSFVVAPLRTTDPSDPLGMLFFVENGPVELIFEGKNSGSLFAFVAHKLTLSKRFFGAEAGVTRETLLEKEFSEVSIIPGQVRRETVAATGVLQGSESIVDLVSDWGLYDASLVTTTRSGSGDPVVSGTTLTFLVFPVRSVAAVSILLGLAFFLVFRMGSARRRSKSNEAARNPVATDPEAPRLRSPKPLYGGGLGLNQTYPRAQHKVPRDLEGLQ